MNKGYSFVEALIVAVILSAVLAAIFGIAYQAQSSFDVERRFTETSQHARIALDEITRYIRQAGNDPYPKEGTPFPAVTWISSNEIEVRSDITGSHDNITGDPDKKLDSPMEHVGIRYVGGQVQIRDYALDTGWEVLAENVTVPPGEKFFTCFDSAGNETTDSDKITSVAVAMTANSAAGVGGRVNSITYRSRVFIRSKTFDIFDYTPQQTGAEE
ncbi:MAG TPA: hypothetical protein PLP42_18815 [Acidobacteriota bacterium]|nr:hypothetical protein [Acidobacteriota bacterium]